jgi:hypothetical protein
VSFSTYNGGDLTDGYARIHSSAPVNSSVGYVFDGLPSVPAFSSAVATSASIPVSIGNGGAQNTGIAILDLSSSPPVVVLTLQDSTGAPVPGGSATVSFSSGKRIVGLLNQLLPGINVGESFKGTLTVQSSYGPFPGGVMSMVALQFDSGNVVSVPITVIR